MTVLISAIILSFIAAFVFFKYKRVLYAWSPATFSMLTYLYGDCLDRGGLCYSDFTTFGIEFILLGLLYIILTAFSIKGWFYFAERKDWLHLFVSLLPILFGSAFFLVLAQ